jgi:Tol biopolymer transport system component
MTTQATTQRAKGPGKRMMAVLVSLAVGAALASVVVLAGPARQADAALAEKIVFMSDRTHGKNVNNPTGDLEIFSMNPDGTGVKQLTTNKVDDVNPTRSPDGSRIAYSSHGAQTSNPEGDGEVYTMSALDGTGKRNLTDNGASVNESFPVFSPGGGKVAYVSYGAQTSNPEGDNEVYVMNTLDGLGKKNLTDNRVANDFVFYD